MGTMEERLMFSPAMRAAGNLSRELRKLDQALDRIYKPNTKTDIKMESFRKFNHDVQIAMQRAAKKASRNFAKEAEEMGVHASIAVHCVIKIKPLTTKKKK
jgi:hypothetical protein